MSSRPGRRGDEQEQRVERGRHGGSPERSDSFGRAYMPTGRWASEGLTASVWRLIRHLSGSRTRRSSARPARRSSSDLSWTIRDGETWAIVGPVGSGKTALTDVLLGRLPVRRVGRVAAPRPAACRRPDGRLAVRDRRPVAFKEESRLFTYGRHYYQQRFNFIEPRRRLTLDEYLQAGTHADDGAIDASPTGSASATCGRCRSSSCPTARPGGRGSRRPCCRIRRC